MDGSISTLHRKREKVWKINEGQAKSQEGITILYKSCSLNQHRMNNVINGTHVHICVLLCSRISIFINTKTRCNEQDETM